MQTGRSYETHGNKRQQAVGLSRVQAIGEPAFQFIDSRPEAVAQRKLKAMLDNSPRAMQLKAFQEMADNSLQVKQAAQLQAIDVVQCKPSLGSELKGEYAGIMGKIAHSGLMLVSEFAPAAEKLVAGFAEKFFTEIKAPVPKVTISEDETAGQGEFDSVTWTLSVGASTPTESINKDSAAFIFGAIYHELYHAEQAIRSVLWALAKGTPEVTIERDLGIKYETILRIKEGGTPEAAADHKAGSWYASRRDGDEAMKDLNKLGLILEESKQMLIKMLPPLASALRAFSADLSPKVRGSKNTLNTVIDSESNEIERVKNLCDPTGYTAPFLAVEKIVSAYRSLSHEKDAHLLGWEIEDTIRGSERVGSYVKVGNTQLITTIQTAYKWLTKLYDASLFASVGEMSLKENQILVLLDKIDEAGFDLMVEWDVRGILDFVSTIQKGVLGNNKTI